MMGCNWLFMWSVLCVTLQVYLTLDEASFYGGSFISIPLKEAKSSTDIHFKFRTHLPNTLILLVAGSTDFCIVQLENSRLKIRINLGAGDSELITSHGIKLNDFKWHNVFIVRKEANLSVVIDNLYTERKRLPGNFFELNIHYGLFVGGQRNYSDLFFGHYESFRGCMSEVMYNGILVLDQARRRQSQAIVHGVTWNCAAEFDATVDKAISFVEDDNFMTIPFTPKHLSKIQFELKTIVEHCILIYNTGPPNKQDHFAIEIWKGKIRVLFKYADKFAELLNDEHVANGHWHRVTIRLSKSTVELTIGSNVKTTKLPRSLNIEYSDTLYIGGIELMKRTRAIAKGLKTADSSYKGCLKGLSIDDKLKGLPNVLVSEGLLAGCMWQYPCLKKPCEDNAQCIQEGLDSFYCKCQEENCISSNYSDGYRVFSRTNQATDMELLSLKSLNVLEGENVLITPSNLHVILDYPKYGIKDTGVKFNIITSPLHGSLTIDVWPNEKNSFTLFDISRDKVHYIHDGSESGNDRMDIAVEFITSESFILPAYLQGKFKFTLSVNITPVNDPPQLSIPATTVLRIAQGTKMLITKDILRVSDPDSTAKQLVINVVDAGPGHFEYKNKPNVPVTSFTLQNVENEQILFVHHSNSNVTFITLKISDGIETSSPSKLRVSTYPQFWRLQNNTGLVLMHHMSSLITPYNLSFVSNVVNSTDNAQFRIVQGPQFGLVEVEKEIGIWDSSVIFASDDIRQHRVRYRHVTSAPEYDEFQFRTTLNMSMLYTFRMTFAKCNLGRINTNKLNIGSNLESTITSLMLDYQTNPVRSDTTSVRYVIVDPPKYGHLFSSISKYVMRYQDSFTQEDISSKHLKYRLYRKSYSDIKDVIKFIVTAPGCKNVTGNLTILHQPSQQTRSNVNVLLKTIQVEEGSLVKIIKSFLNVEYNDITSLIFNITKLPSHGILQVLYENVIIRNATNYFTLNELYNGQVYYVHDDSESEKDYFDFVALSSEEENFEYANTFYINVLLKNDNEPVRVIDKVFHVVVGGQKYINGEDLKYEDKDIGTQDFDIVYTCREISNGDIYNSKNPSQNISTFTQADLNNNLVLFKHRGSEYGKMKFSIHDGQFYSVGTLEIQASAPFIHVITNKKLLVQHGKSAAITSQHLVYTTNLFATEDDVVYEIINKPISGKIIFESKETNEFTQSLVNEDKIYYVNNGGTVTADEVNLRVRCRDAVTSVQLGIWILPASYWKPLVVRNLRTLVVEETTSALLSKSVLEVSQPDVPSSAITYYISEFPVNGYVSILPAIPNGEDQSSNVRMFTQALMNDNRVIYVQSIANETQDQVVFNVTNGMVWLYDLTLDIQIIPERLYLGSNVLIVNEGGVAALTLTHLHVVTDYYKSRVSDYVILEKPKHGCIQVHRKCNKHDGFSHKDLAVGAVHYANDGSENSYDEITLVAVAGQKRSIPLNIPIKILPINNQKPKVVNNTGLVMWEGGSVVITNFMLAAVDADHPTETLTYTVLDSSFGKIYLQTNPNVSVNSFTQESIDKGLVLFKHRNGSDAKFRFNVSDGLHFTKENTFYIKAKPVILRLIQIRPLHIFPFQKKYLTSQNMLSCISDPSRQIEYEIITPPSIGRLMTESETAGIFKMVNTFSQEDINASRIFYEHIHEFEDLYTSDSFIFNIKSYLAQPILNQKLKIDISVYSGGLDAYVSIPKIVVDEGGVTNVPLNISGVVTFLENHASIKSPVLHASAMQPKHGQIFLQNNPNLTTFTQHQLQSGQVHYQHDHSDSLKDTILFSLYLIPNYVMLCNISVPVTINPINDQPFKLITPAPHLTVVQGESYIITKNDLSTEDADTLPKDLKYDIVTGPSRGLVILLPEFIPVSQFTQLDINENKIAYLHNSSALTDSFHMRVLDGKFKPEYFFFNVKVISAYLNVSTGLPIYLQQGSNVVQFSEKQFVVDTNTNKKRINYSLKEPPRHGVIYVNDNPANEFTHDELENDRVMYMQTDMTTANDSFRIFVGMMAGNTLIGNEINLILTVQPLMQIGNFTVLTGDTNKITLYVLDATPLAKLTNSNPKYTVIRVPEYGQIRKIIRSSGDRRNILDTAVTTFTHEEVQSGLIYIVVKDIEVGWGGLQDRLGFILAASIFQPAVGELKITVRSALLNEIHSTLAGPSNPAGHEGGMHIASPNMTRDYFLIVSMVAGVVILGVAVIIIIKCRSLEPEELNKEEQCLQPIPLPRPPDRLMSSSPPLKHAQDGFNSPVSTTLPHCKVTPLARTDIETHARYPYGVDEHSDDWSSCDASDPACPSRNNIMLRRNQYWV